MRRVGFTIISALLVFVLVGCGGPPAPVSVQGVVTVDGDLPGDQKVSISAVGTELATQSDSEGRFALELTPGNYTLKAEGAGLSPEFLSIRVKKGQDLTGLKIALQRESDHAVHFDLSSVPDGKLPEGTHVFAGDWRVENGKLIGQAASFAGGQIILSDTEWTDFEYEATITYIAFNDAARWAAMLYRGQPEGGHPYQLFTVRQGSSAANGAELARRTPGDTWDVAIKVPLAEDRQLGRPYRFKIIVQGTGAKYFIDNKLVIETDTEVVEEKGTVGFMVDGGTISVEDVIVRPLT